QPAKLRRRVCKHRSGCIAIRLPGQSGTDTDGKYDQEASEAARGSLAERRPLDHRVARWPGGQVCRELGWQRVEGRSALFARGRSIRHRRRGAECVGQARGGRARPLGCRVATLLAHLRGLAVSLFDLLEDLGGNAVGCAILLNALAKERLEKLASFVGRR